MAKRRRLEIIIQGKDKISKTLKKIHGGMKRWGASLLRITGGVAAGFLAMAGAAGAFFNKIANNIDTQAKMASALGIQNKQLGAMRDAADYAGIATENLYTALRKMSQGIGDAVNGTGEAKDALETLGLEADTLAAMKPEAAFSAIIAELDKIPNGIKKTTLAMDLFGRSGASMTNLTIKGLQQAQADADRLGLKLTTAQAANVEAANDAWSRIKNAAGDFLKYVTAKLAPSLKKGFDSAFDFIKGKDLQKWAAETALAIVKAFRGALVVLGAVGESVVVIVRGMAAVSALANKIIGGLAAMKTTGTQKAIGHFEGKIAELEAKGNLSEKQQKRLEHFRGELQNAEKVLAAYTKLADTALDIDATLESVSNTLAAAQGFSMSPEAKKAYTELEKTVKGFNTEQEKTPEKSKKAGDSIGIFAADSAQALALVGTQAERINSALEKLSGTEWKINLTGIDRFEVSGVDVLANMLEKTKDQ